MPNYTNSSERIDYLVHRRFPNANMLRVAVSSLSSRRFAPDTTKLREAVEAYRKELAALTFDELAARFEEEQRREGEQLWQRLDREEQERFFNQPHAQADYDHWSKAAHWTLDEAIALSFGRAPEVVRWERLQSLTELGSPFVYQYARRRDLALRAKTWKQLYDPVLPGFFLAWAKRTDIAVPPELTAAVEKRGVQVADWKSNYDDALATLNSQKESYEKQVAGWREAFDKAKAALNENHTEWMAIAADKNQQIAELEARIASLEQLPPEASQIPAEKPLRTRERDSLLKLVIGMAVKGYVYDPKAARSDSVAEIVKDLALVGVPLDDDTVRKWLREAAELLPPK